MRIVDGERDEAGGPRRRQARIVATSKPLVRPPGRYAFVKALQALALLVAAFLLLRIVGPWLIDLHDTAALILAVVLLVAGLFAIVWFAWSLIVSLLRKG